jgi:hypothetical protein
MTASARSRTRAFVATALAAAAALALAGCSTSTSAVKDYRGEPKGVDAPASSAGGAPFSVWLHGGDQFTVTLYGSSTCPPVATKFKLVGKNQMTITVPDPAAKNKVCTMDYVPHTTVFDTPNTVDRHRDVKITAQEMTFVLQGLPASK